MYQEHKNEVCIFFGTHVRIAPVHFYTRSVPRQHPPRFHHQPSIHHIRLQTSQVPQKNDAQFWNKNARLIVSGGHMWQLIATPTKFSGTPATHQQDQQMHPLHFACPKP